MHIHTLCFPAALQDILAAFQMPDNVLRLEEARDNAGNDMMKMMQIVFPVTTQIQMDVVQKYGFSGDGDGKYIETSAPRVDMITSVLYTCRVLARISKMPVQNSNFKMSGRPDLATNLLQILIPATFNSLVC